MHRIVMLVGLASCATTTYRYSAVTPPIARDPILAGNAVYIHFERVHYKQYDREPGALESMLVGTHEGQQEDSENIATDDLGVAVIDLSRGTCANKMGSLPAPDPRNERPIQIHGHPLVGMPGALHEMDDARKTVVAEYRPPQLASDTTLMWFLGFWGNTLVFRHEPRTSLFLFDLVTTQWREISYRRCQPR